MRKRLAEKAENEEEGRDNATAAGKPDDIYWQDADASQMTHRPGLRHGYDWQAGPATGSFKGPHPRSHFPAVKSGCGGVLSRGFRQSRHMLLAASEIQFTVSTSSL